MEEIGVGDGELSPLPSQTTELDKGFAMGRQKRGLAGIRERRWLRGRETGAGCRSYPGRRTRDRALRWEWEDRNPGVGANAIKRGFWLEFAGLREVGPLALYFFFFSPFLARFYFVFLFFKFSRTKKESGGREHHPRHMMLTLVLLEGEAAVWLSGHILASGNDPFGKISVFLPSSGRGLAQRPMGNVGRLEWEQGTT